MKAIEYYTRLLQLGTISRREFMGRALAMGATVAMASTLASGTLKAATAKKGGRLRIGTAGGSTTDSLDPATITDTMMQIISQGQLRNSLTEVDASGNLIPELAESWDSSPDAAVWTFKLRKGVEFHNGKSLEAQDVIDSINHHRGAESKSAAKGIVDPIKEIKADGKNTVVFTLDGGNADFPFIMSDYHLTIQPAATKDLSDGVGTGGYMLVNYEPGVRALTKRSPNFWKEGKAHFDEVETIGISDVNARTNALVTGEIDVMNRADLKTVHLLKRKPGIEIINVTGTKHYTYAMRTNAAPFDDNDVRLAMKYAIDREEIVRTVLRGFGIVGNDHPIAPTNRFFAKDLPQRQYDPDKAKFHLKKAGRLGETFQLSTANAAWDGAVDAAILFKERAAKAGINIEVTREPNDGYWDNVWLKKPWTAVFWSGRPTEDWMFSMAYAAGASWNDTVWEHDRFNMLLKAGRAELDTSKRREIYVEMQQIVRDEGATIVHAFASDLHGASDKLAHGEVGGNWEFDGFRIAERWWFK